MPIFKNLAKRSYINLRPALQLQHRWRNYLALHALSSLIQVLHAACTLNQLGVLLPIHASSSSSLMLCMGCSAWPVFIPGAK